KPLRHFASSFGETVNAVVVISVGEPDRRPDNVVVGEFQCEVRVVRWAHDLVELFAGANTHCFLPKVRRHTQRQVHDTNGGNLGDEDLATDHALKVLEHEVDTLLQGDPEAGHFGVRDGQMIVPFLDQRLKEWHDRAAATHDVAITGHREPGASG